MPVSADLVVVQNKLNQRVGVSVVQGGMPVVTALQAGESFGPVERSVLTDHTIKLAQLGHVIIRPA